MDHSNEYKASGLSPGPSGQLDAYATSGTRPGDEPTPDITSAQDPPNSVAPSQTSNALTWYEQTVIASVKARTLRLGKRYDAVNKFVTMMIDEGGCWKEEHLGEMEPVLIETPPLYVAGQSYVDKHGTGIARIYLSPLLEFDRMSAVIHTVAHEFAHVYLGHHRGKGSIANAKLGLAHEERQHEKDADALAERWGFKKPRGKNWLAKYIVGQAPKMSNKDKQRLTKCLLNGMIAAGAGAQ